VENREERQGSSQTASAPRPAASATLSSAAARHSIVAMVVSPATWTIADLAVVAASATPAALASPASAMSTAAPDTVQDPQKTLDVRRFGRMRVDEAENYVRGRLGHRLERRAAIHRCRRTSSSERICLVSTAVRQYTWKPPSTSTASAPGGTW